MSPITLCDLSKALDNINYDMLLRKFNMLKIDSFWFNTYLNQRTQSVRMGKHFSDKREVSYGVPQGSVLDPILSLIYVNDLSQYTPDYLVIQYAD